MSVRIPPLHLHLHLQYKDPSRRVSDGVRHAPIRRLTRHSDGTLTLRNRRMIGEEEFGPDLDRSRALRAARSRRYYQKRKAKQKPGDSGNDAGSDASYDALPDASSRRHNDALPDVIMTRHNDPSSSSSAIQRSLSLHRSDGSIDNDRNSPGRAASAGMTIPSRSISSTILAERL
jgi:hypothetical protein